MEKEKLLEVLSTVVDPELGVNIVDLGLVYEAREENGKVYVQMTLTTAGCPLHETMVGGVKSALRTLPGVRDIEVEVVWNPPWTPGKLSDKAKRTLGYFG